MSEPVVIEERIERPPVSVAVVPLAHFAGLELPRYETAGAAGMDLAAAIPTDQEQGLYIAPGERALVPTGLTIALPDGWELQIRPRSGATLKRGIMVANSPGTIDADYRGEIKVIVLNATDEPLVIKRGERIAQAVLAPVFRVEWEVVEELPETARGAGGFGSTDQG